MYLRCFATSRLDQYTILRTGIWLVWVAGLSLGFAADRLYGDAFGECIALAPVEVPTVSGLFTVNVLPLLISACAVLISPYLLYPLCLFRGGLLGASLSAVASIYGAGAGIMSSLLLFSSLVFSPFLLYFWVGLIQREHKSFGSSFLFYGGIGLLVAALDNWVIVPFLREILIF